MQHRAQEPARILPANKALVCIHAECTAPLLEVVPASSKATHKCGCGQKYVSARWIDSHLESIQMRSKMKVA
jgi:hypothetical protein